MASIFDKLKKILSKQSARIKFPIEKPYSQTGPGFYLSQVYGNQRLATSIYEQSMQATADRLMRLRDYDSMDTTPIITTALNVYADDAASYNEYEQVLSIVSENERVQKALEQLFFDILDIDFNSYHWVRTLCKYGDYFHLLNIEEGKGITGFISLPTSELEREEAFDGNPNSVRFRWLAQTSGFFDEVQISHFRLRGDDMYLPYGRSILESGRRSWKQLQLLEDAMLIYRISRAAEKRVFQIDVGAIPPEQVMNYLEQQRSRLKSEQLINPTTGEIDLRYRVSALTDDYWFAKRGEALSSIETLPGASNLNDIEDVEYIRQQLITSLGVPKAFLQYDDDLEGKSSASKVDIRFARTIQRVQKICVSELSRMAIIHLAAKGFDDNDLYNFEIKMQNPSAIMELGKIEIQEKRFDLYQKAVNDSKAISPERGRREILHLSEEEIKEEKSKIIDGAKFNKKLKDIEEPQQGAEGMPPAEEEAPAEDQDGTSKMLDDLEEEEKDLKSPLGKFGTIRQGEQGELNTKTKTDLSTEGKKKKTDKKKFTKDILNKLNQALDTKKTSLFD